jgi:catechol 2,3-dioxygenase-like lactoylglutathione lyase family enzyme
VFDHVGVAVSDLAASERFYRTVLEVLGVEPSYAGADMVGWDDWWIGPTDREHPVTRGLHVGFRAGDRTQVDTFWQAGIDAGYSDAGPPGPRTQYSPTYYGGFVASPAQDDATVRAFHAAALAAGYEDHGAPGERAVYHPGYYAAFVLDPDGHNVEVVNHNR